MKNNVIKETKYDQETERLALQDVPPVLMQYVESRNRERTGDYHHYLSNHGKQFCETARLLADVEDDFPIVEIMKLDDIVYQGMSLVELRSYFALRTGFRKGIFPKVPMEYVNLYVMETMLLIGVKNVEEAWTMLQKIRQVYTKKMLDDLPQQRNVVSSQQYDLLSYRVYAPLYQLNQNIKDFVIFNNMSNHLLPTFEEELKGDAASIKLRHLQELSDDDLWELLPYLSRYDFTCCARLVDDADFVKRTVVKVLRDLDTYYRDYEQSGLMEQQVCEHHYLHRFSFFYTHVFPPKDARKDKVIFVFDEVRRYIRKNGDCFVELYACPDVDSRQSKIYYLLREIDRQIRIICKHRDMLKSSYLPDSVMEIITSIITQENQAAAAVWQQKALAKKAQQRQEALEQEAQRRQAVFDRKFKINLGKLSTIRSDAAATREQLLNDEERGLMKVAPPPAGGKKKAASQPAAKPAVSKANDSTQSNASASLPNNPSLPAVAPSASLLSPDEQQLLQLLLSAGDWRAFLQQKHLMLSVIVEAVNDKLFDTLGDVVLQDSDGQPEIIEDYREELARLFPSLPAQSSRPHKKSKLGE